MKVGEKAAWARGVLNGLAMVSRKVFATCVASSLLKHGVGGCRLTRLPASLCIAGGTGRSTDCTD